MAAQRVAAGGDDERRPPPPSNATTGGSAARSTLPPSTCSGGSPLGHRPGHLGLQPGDLLRHVRRGQEGARPRLVAVVLAARHGTADPGHGQRARGPLLARLLDTRGLVGDDGGGLLAEHVADREARQAQAAAEARRAPGERAHLLEERLRARLPAVDDVVDLGRDVEGHVGQLEGVRRGRGAVALGLELLPRLREVVVHLEVRVARVLDDRGLLGGRLAGRVDGPPVERRGVVDAHPGDARGPDDGLGEDLGGAHARHVRAELAVGLRDEAAGRRAVARVAELLARDEDLLGVGEARAGPGRWARRARARGTRRCRRRRATRSWRRRSARRGCWRRAAGRASGSRRRSRCRGRRRAAGPRGGRRCCRCRRGRSGRRRWPGGGRATPPCSAPRP